MSSENNRTVAKDTNEHKYLGLYRMHKHNADSGNEGKSEGESFLGDHFKRLQTWHNASQQQGGGVQESQQKQVEKPDQKRTEGSR